MSIPESIKKKHIEEACDAVIQGQEIIPTRRKSTDHCMVFQGIHFPPKFVISLAAKYANEKELPASQFSGGPETNNFLLQRSFDVVECTCGGLPLGNEKTYTHKVARLVCTGAPPRNPKKAGSNLKKYFTDYWTKGVRVHFAITPGGFMSVPFPGSWNGKTGWNSCQEDIQPLYDKAETIVREILNAELYALAAKCTDILTLGFDFMDEVEDIGVPHAELVAVVNLAKKKISWTGKSYPVGNQENTLVHITDIDSHFIKFNNERILVLGCHDLNAYSNRAKPKEGSPRFARQKMMREQSAVFNPTIVLHHPHSTDSAGIWPVAWSGVRQHLWNRIVKGHVYASGIAWFQENENPRSELENVLRTTKLGDVIDIIPV